jgi:hypothetical protein
MSIIDPLYHEANCGSLDALKVHPGHQQKFQANAGQLQPLQPVGAAQKPLSEDEKRFVSKQVLVACMLIVQKHDSHFFQGQETLLLSVIMLVCSSLH